MAVIDRQNSCPLFGSLLGMNIDNEWAGKDRSVSVPLAVCSVNPTSLSRGQFREGHILVQL